MRYWVYLFHSAWEPKLREVGFVDVNEGESAYEQALSSFGKPERRATLIVQKEREESMEGFEEKRENALQLIARSTNVYH
jgi:hypothetical protein